MTAPVSQEPQTCSCGSMPLGLACVPTWEKCLRTHTHQDLPSSETRRRLEDPGGGDFVKFRFSPDALDTRIDVYDVEGRIAGLVGRQMVGILQDFRDVETEFGIGKAADVAIIDTEKEWHGLVVGFFCTSMLRRLIEQVHVGEKVEITRMPDKGRAHNYEVVVLE